MKLWFGLQVDEGHFGKGSEAQLATVAETVSRSHHKEYFNFNKTFHQLDIKERL